MTSTRLTLAVPDMISSSFFPVLAAAELGLFAAQGLDVTLHLMAPTDRAFTALKAGEIDLVGAEAHAALGIFPDWAGIELLCAQSQGTYWFLVMRADLDVARGDIAAVRGRRIAAAPWVDIVFKHLLAEAGIAPRDVEIATLPELTKRHTNTGVTLAQALEDGRIDGFWANGMGAAKAVQRGAGTIVLDVRRGDGPPGAFDYTLPVVAATSQFVADRPDVAAAVVKAIAATHAALAADVHAAATVGAKLFPAEEAALIEGLVAADLPFYDAGLPPRVIADLNAFSRAVGLLTHDVPYDTIVPPGLARYWRHDAVA